MQAYLEVEELWDTIKVPEGSTLSADPKKNQKARGRIILSVEPDVYPYLEATHTAHDAWEALSKTFNDPGMNRKVNLLIEVSTTRYENCKSMEDYVARIIGASQRLEAIGTKIPTDLVGALMLAGLPQSYKPMIMALANSGQNVDADFVKTKLLEEAESSSENVNGNEIQIQGYAAQAHPAHFSSQRSANRGRHGYQKRSGTRRNNDVRCYNCNRFGHIARSCTAPKRNNQSACTAAADDESEDEDVECALLASISSGDTHLANVGAAFVDPDASTPPADNTFLTVSSTHSLQKDEWILDSGASTHMCYDRVHMTNFREAKVKNVTTANKEKVPVLGEGNILMQYSAQGEKRQVILKNVLYVPKITTNLLSVSAIAKKGGKVFFSGSTCHVYNRNDVKILVGQLSTNNIYKVKLEPRPPQIVKSCSEIALNASIPCDIQLWHRRMGHLNATYLKQLRQTAVGINFGQDLLYKCEVCVAGKLVQKPFKPNNKRAAGVLELVHSDVCQVEEPSIGKAKYFVTFLDDHTRKTFVYFLKHKDEVPDVTVKFIKFAEKQTGQKIKRFRTDNGREYLNNRLKSALEELGVKHETSIAYQPQQNGRAERVNRTLLEKARCMLVEAALPYRFWAEAISTACYLSNRSPKRCLGGRTPEELWTGHKPDLSHLRVFGSNARAYIPGHLRKKVDPTSRPAILVGYSEDQRGYRLWSAEDQKVFVASNVEFFETELKTSPAPAYLPMNSLQNMDLDQDERENHDVPERENFYQDLPGDPVVPVNNQLDFRREEPRNKQLVFRREESVNKDAPVNDIRPLSQKTTVNKENVLVSAKSDVAKSRKRKMQSEKDEVKKKSAKLTDMSSDQQPTTSGLSRPLTRSATKNTQSSDPEDSEDEYQPGKARRTRRRPKHLDDYVTYSVFSESDEPKTIEQALSGPEAHQWRQAMDSEYNSIQKNNTWVLCNLPYGEAVVGSKWIFKKKPAADGTIQYKARLVAQGFSQIKGLNYDETYAPVVRFTSLRLLFAYAARRGLDIFHLDVETAFLHGDMDKTVYLQQPKGYIVKGQQNKVCKLRKSIYGLKQGSRNWNLKLDSALQGLNLTKSSYDSCIYSYYNNVKCIIVALFVDDLVVFTDSIDFLQILKSGLQKICTLKDLGPLKKCLGIRVHQDKSKAFIELDQTEYVESLLTHYGMADCRSTSTPMDPSGEYKSAMSPQSAFNPADTPYQSAVGSLLYLVQGTRPDLAYAVSVISRHNQSHTETHWNMIKRILRYIQGTKNFRLRYSRDADCQLHGYCDAGGAMDKEDPRCTTGYTFMLQGAAISWNSRRQSTVALSSTEAEYLSLSAATQEALWLRRLASELLIIRQDEPLLIYCDNKGAIDLSKNSKFSGRTKHIDVRHHFVRESIDSGQIAVSFVPSTHMLADALTKAIGRSKLEGFVKEIGLKSEERRE